MSRAIQDGWKRFHRKGIIEILNWGWKHTGLHDVPNNRFYRKIILANPKLRSKIY